MEAIDAYPLGATSLDTLGVAAHIHQPPIHTPASPESIRPFGASSESQGLVVVETSCAPDAPGSQVRERVALSKVTLQLKLQKSMLSDDNLPITHMPMIIIMQNKVFRLPIVSWRRRTVFHRIYIDISSMGRFAVCTRMIHGGARQANTSR